jgi:glycogen phosphorylase
LGPYCCCGWQGLKPHAEDAEFRKKWAAIKFHNKQALAAKIKEWTGIEVPVAALYDIHIKRIHEYKRQYMNAVSVIYRYKQIKVWYHCLTPRIGAVCSIGLYGGTAAVPSGNRPIPSNTTGVQEATPEERKKMVPRVVIVGGKAASAYYMAKKIVKLVNAIGETVNSDPDVGDLLKVRCAANRAAWQLIRWLSAWLHSALCTCQHFMGPSTSVTQTMACRV